MMRYVRGALMTVTDAPIGSALMGDHASGVAVLQVRDTIEFNEAPTGGMLRLGDDTTHEEIAYTGIDDDNGLVLLAGATMLAWEDGTPVAVMPVTNRKKLTVKISDDGEPAVVDVPSIWFPMVQAVIANPDAQHVVTLKNLGDGDYELYDIPTLPKLLDGATLAPGTIPDDVFDPANPPAAAPVVEAKAAAVGVVRATWEPVTDARSYEVAASLSTPVPTDGTATVGSTISNSFPIDTIDGGRVPAGDDAPPVNVIVRAVNALGAGPWSTEVSATARKADIDELNVEQLNAYTIETLNAYISDLQTDIVTTSGRIIIGPESGAHIVIDPQVGLLLYAPDGVTVVVKLDMTDAQLSEFTGKINASRLSVLNGLELRGQLSRIVSDALLTLSSSIDNPSAPPSLTIGLETRPWKAMPTGYIECGMFWETSTSLWWQLLWRSDTNRAAVRALDSTGTQVGDTITLTNDLADGDRVSVPCGLVKVGTYLYTIRRFISNENVGNREWLLIKYTSTGAEDGHELIGYEFADPGVVGDYPTLGFDGTNLVAGSLSTTVYLIDLGDDGRSGFVRYSPTDGSHVNHAYFTGPIGEGLYGRGCGIATLPGYGGTRFWIANAYRVYTFTFSGSILTVDAAHPIWELEGLSTAVGYDGTNFYSSFAGNTLKKYTNFLAASEAQRKFWAQYAWENGASATAPSDAASIDLPDRRFVTIGVPTPTAGTTTTRVFTGNGATQPARTAMYSRGTTTDPSMQVSTVVTSGANPRAASDFSTGTPARIQSQIGGLYFDGAGNFAAPLRLQAGTSNISSGSTGITVSVTFPTPFATVPVVSVQSYDLLIQTSRITTISTTGFSVRFDRGGSQSGGYNYGWQAIAA